MTLYAFFACGAYLEPQIQHGNVRRRKCRYRLDNSYGAFIKDFCINT